MKNKIKIIGNLLTIISIIYILKTILNADIDLHKVLNRQNMLLLVIVVLIQIIVVICSSIPWVKLVRFLGFEKCEYKYAINIFLKANILKYLPGNFFHYVGRNQLAIDCELNHADVTLATLVDTLIGLSVGVVFSIIFFGECFWEFINWHIIFLFLFVIVGFFLVVYQKKKIFGFFIDSFFRFFTMKGAKTLFVSIVYYCFQNAITILIVVMISIIVTGNVDIKNQIILGSGYIFASVVGTLTPGAPAGIGIRESVMMNMAGSFSTDEILLLVVIMRIVGVIGDLFSFIISVIMLSKRKVRDEENKLYL